MFTYHRDFLSDVPVQFLYISSLTKVTYQSFPHACSHTCYHQDFLSFHILFILSYSCHISHFMFHKYFSIIKLSKKHIYNKLDKTQTNQTTLTILTHSYLLSWYIQIINTCELVSYTVTMMLHQWSVLH